MEKLLKLLFKMWSKIEKSVEIFSWKNLKNVFGELSEGEGDAPSEGLSKERIEERGIVADSLNNEKFLAKILEKFLPWNIDTPSQNFEKISSKNQSRKLPKNENSDGAFWGENGEKFLENNFTILEILTQNFSPKTNTNFPLQNKKLTTQNNFFEEFQSNFFRENSLQNFHKISTLNNFFNEINFSPSAQNFDVENSTTYEFAKVEKPNFEMQISPQKIENLQPVFQNSGDENPNFSAEDFREIVANIVGDFIDTSLRINGFKIQ